MSKEIFAEAKAKIDELSRKDKERVELEAARNSVESYCYLIKNRLVDNEDSIAKVSTEEQREEIRQLGADVTDWLDFDAYDADLETFQAKFKELSEPAEKIWFRMNELTARPQAVASMNEKLSKVDEIVKKWETTMPQITEEERGEVQAKVDEIKVWIDTKLAEQDTKQPHEEPAFSSAEVPLQSKSLERLMNKLSKKPKPKPVKKKEEVDKADNNTKAEGEATEEASAEESKAKEDNAGDESKTEEEVASDESRTNEESAGDEANAEGGAPADKDDQKASEEDSKEGDDEL